MKQSGALKSAALLTAWPKYYLMIVWIVFGKETRSKQLLEPSEVEIWVMDWWPIQGVSLPPADRWERPRQPPRDPDINRKWTDRAILAFLKPFLCIGFSHKCYDKNQLRQGFTYVLLLPARFSPLLWFPKLGRLKVDDDICSGPQSIKIKVYVSNPMLQSQHYWRRLH